MQTEDEIEYLSAEMVEKLDIKMKELKGIGLSDIDLYIIRYALSITNKPQTNYEKNKANRKWAQARK